jgi:ATP-dependent RNA helicase DDX47/RRP3
VLLMLERVAEAQRMATMQMRERDKGRGKRKSADDADDESGAGRNAASKYGKRPQRGGR